MSGGFSLGTSGNDPCDIKALGPVRLLVCIFPHQYRVKEGPHPSPSMGPLRPPYLAIPTVPPHVLQIAVDSWSSIAQINPKFYVLFCIDSMAPIVLLSQAGAIGHWATNRGYEVKAKFSSAVLWAKNRLHGFCKQGREKDRGEAKRGRRSSASPKIFVGIEKA